MANKLSLVINKKSRRIIILAACLAFIAPFIIFSLPAKAELSLSHGAEWRYYALSSGTTSVSFPGATFLYPFVNEGSLSGCTSGGYWRHAAVTSSLVVVSLKFYYAGDQVGVTSIGANSNTDHNSIHFGGKMNDLNPSSWNKAEIVYAESKGAATAGWNGNTSLSLFCGKSTVTGLTTYTSTSTAPAITKLNKEQDKASITFSHKISGTSPSNASYSKITNSGAASGYTTLTPGQYDIANTVTFSINPGETKQVCQQADFSPLMGQISGGKLVRYAGAGSSSACAEAYREAYAEFSTKTELAVSGKTATANSNGTTSLDDKFYVNSTNINEPLKFNFTHYITRTNQSYDTNTTLSVGWTINNGTTSTNGTTSLAKNTTKQAKTENFNLYSTESSHATASNSISLGSFRQPVCQKIYTPKSATIGYNNTVTWSSEQVWSEACAYAYRPYNFKLKLSLDNIPEVVYGGENIALSVSVKNEANNGVTEQKGYHSASPNDTQVKIYAHAFDKNASVNDVKEHFKILRTDDKLEEITSPIAPNDIATVSRTYAVGYPEVGSKICYIATVNYNTSSSTPSDKNDYDNLYGYKVSKALLTSGITCQIVAKRATFQVWGGSIFSNGSMTASTYLDTRSWADYGIISNSTISNISSAADKSAEGSNDMTISNNDSAALGRANIIHTDSIKKQLIKHLVDKDTEYTGTEYTGKTSADAVNISDDTNYDGTTFCPSANNECSSAKKYRVTDAKITTTTLGSKTRGNLTIAADRPLPSGTTHIIYAHDIYINSNLTYYDGPYINAFYVPQYIIYATGNINIAASVTRIDAILVADGTINTCTESTSSDMSDRDKCGAYQLKINGAIFANRLNLTRSYSDSNKSPAELITFPASTSFWANSQAEDYSRATTTYIRELAPRY